MMTTSLTRLDPFTLIDDVFRQARSPLAEGAQRRTGFVPAIDTHREDEDLVLRADLPGIDPDEDVSVELDGRTLTISGQRNAQTEAEGRREVRYGSFSRTVTLPQDVSHESVSADYEAGVLMVRVTGLYTEEKPHRISIGTGTGTAQQVAAAEPENDQQDQSIQA